MQNFFASIFRAPDMTSTTTNRDLIDKVRSQSCRTGSILWRGDERRSPLTWIFHRRMGSTGDPPVPPGHWPGGTSEALEKWRDPDSARASQPFRSASRRTAPASGLCYPPLSKAYEVCGLTSKREQFSPNSSSPSLRPSPPGRGRTFSSAGKGSPLRFFQNPSRRRVRARGLQKTGQNSMSVGPLPSAGQVLKDAHLIWISGFGILSAFGIRVFLANLYQKRRRKASSPLPASK